MARLGRADVVVVGEAHAVPQRAELRGDLVGELLRWDASGGGGALDLLAVLVGAGEEEGVVAEQAVTAREHVGNDGRVRMADVRPRVDVVDRRGEVKLLLFWRTSGSTASLQAAEPSRAYVTLSGISGSLGAPRRGTRSWKMISAMT